MVFSNRERIKLVTVFGIPILTVLIFAAWAVTAKGEFSRTDVIVCGATVLYTILTGGLLWAAYFSNRPIITIYMERERMNVYLVVANNGNRPATDVKLKFDGPIKVDDRDLSKTTGIFKYPIGSLPAGGTIVTGFGFGTSLFPGDKSEEDLSNSVSGITEERDDDGGVNSNPDRPSHQTTLYLEGEVTYTDLVTGRGFRHKVVLDARYLEGVTWFTSSSDRNSERYARETRDELRKIRRLLSED